MSPGNEILYHIYFSNLTIIILTDHSCTPNSKNTYFRLYAVSLLTQFGSHVFYNIPLFIVPIHNPLLHTLVWLSDYGSLIWLQFTDTFKLH